MTYTPQWTHGNAQGRLVSGEDPIHLADAQDLVDPINRRRLLVYQAEEDFTEDLCSGAHVKQRTIAAAQPPPYRHFRFALSGDILSPTAGVLGGSPPSPSAMCWLWPVAGADENKVIVSGAQGVGEDEVGLFQKLNGTATWTDESLNPGQTHIRAVHFNELRQSVEWIRRGRWEMPIYFAAGIFSPLPDTPWLSEAIANNGMHELRNLGFAFCRTDHSPSRGLTDVAVRVSSSIQITADADCVADLYRCHASLEFVNDPPTWNESDPSAPIAWSSPGATGAGDATYLGCLNLAAGVPASLSNDAVRASLQAIVDGAEQNFLIRRADTGANTIGVTGKLVIEFDLDCPPN